MSTAVRILLLVVALVIPIISYLICIRISNKIEKYVGSDLKKRIVKIINISYATILIGTIIILLFCFPSQIFLSIEKVLTIFCGLISICFLDVSAAITFYLVSKKNNQKYIYIIKFAYALCVVLVFFAIIILPNVISQNSIEEIERKEVTQTTEPFITKQYKGVFISRDKKGNLKSCKYYYINNDTLETNEIAQKDILGIIYLDSNKDSFIEKTGISTECINHEMKTSSDEYHYTKYEEYYVLYLNKDQIIYN